MTAVFKFEQQFLLKKTMYYAKQVQKMHDKGIYSGKMYETIRTRFLIFCWLFLYITGATQVSDFFKKESPISLYPIQVQKKVLQGIKKLVLYIV